MSNSWFVKVRDSIYITIAFCIGGYVEFILPSVLYSQVFYQALSIFSMMSLVYVVTTYLYEDSAPDIVNNKGPLYFWMYLFVVLPIYYLGILISIISDGSMENIALFIWKYGNPTVLIVCYVWAMLLLFTKKGEELVSRFEQENE
ncbi:TPA: hypothetical protein NKU94_000659 [Vibrio parahaemolyticus]|nr:hypothetical protein [Vibrio parahaemolyticus]